MGGVVHEVLDHVTDVSAIAALTYLSVNSAEPLTADLIAALTTIAIGQRYAKHKWKNKSTDET